MKTNLGMIEFPAYLLAPDDSHPITLTPAYSCSESDLVGKQELCAGTSG